MTNNYCKVSFSQHKGDFVLDVQLYHDSGHQVVYIAFPVIISRGYCLPDLARPAWWEHKGSVCMAQPNINYNNLTANKMTTRQLIK